MFFVGQKVVCVDDSPINGQSAPVRKGQQYTVSRLYAPGDRDVDVPSHRYEDHGVEVAPVGRPACFLLHRFRPATDISVFTAILAKFSAPLTMTAEVIAARIVNDGEARL